MAFTDKSGLYLAAHEDGINTVIKHVMRQRPSLFNYGTALIQAKPELLCQAIETAPGVTQLITVQPPIPLFGANNFAMNYCIQLTNLEIEFHPGNVITLPAELHPPLAAQRFAFRARVCGGIGCPSKEERPLFDGLFNLDKLRVKQAFATSQSIGTGRPTLGTITQTSPLGARQAATEGQLATGLRSLIPGIRPPLSELPTEVIDFPTTFVFPTRALSCFCLDLTAIGQGDILGSAGNQKINIDLDSLEIVDLAPAGLESSLECYLLLVANKVVLDQVNTAISNTLFSLVNVGGGSLKLSASTAVPNNPAIEENQLKSFINMDQFNLTVPPIVVKEGGGGPAITKTVRARSSTGPFDLTAALSKGTFIRLFQAIRDHSTFDITVTPRTIFGPVKASGKFVFHLDNGAIDFGADNTVRIKELAIKWDVLQVNLSVNLPEICIPPFKICVPFLGCTPQVCVFEGENDIVIPLNIPGIFTSEVSMNLRPKVYYGTSSAGNKWIVQLEPIGPVDLDIISVSDTIGDLLEDAIEAALGGLGLPDEILDILDWIVDRIRDLLDIGDDVQEWIKRVVFEALGIELGIDNLLVKLFTDEFQVLDLDDPVEVLEQDSPLIPVQIPIEFVGARVNQQEMIIEADVEK
jgi:hypothetical protein